MPLPEIIQRAERLIEEGGTEEARALLAELVAQDEPEALYLQSHFPLFAGESDRDFECRRIEMLTKAADRGHAEAMFSLGLAYLFGDYVAVDRSLASSLFEKSAKAGSARGKYEHALNLYHGAEGIERDLEKAHALLLEAEKEGVTLATEALEALDFGA